MGFVDKLSIFMQYFIPLDSNLWELLHGIAWTPSMYKHPSPGYNAISWLHTSTYKTKRKIQSAESYDQYYIVVVIKRCESSATVGGPASEHSDGQPLPVCSHSHVLHLATLRRDEYPDISERLMLTNCGTRRDIARCSRYRGNPTGMQQGMKWLKW
jgi:hypothetical protein